MSEAIPKRCVIVSNWDVSCQFDWWSSAGMTIIRRIVWGLSNYHCMGSVRLWSWPAGPLPTLKVASTPIYYQWEAAAPTVHCVSSCANRRRMICQWCVDPGNGGKGAPLCRSNSIIYQLEDAFGGREGQKPQSDVHREEKSRICKIDQTDASGVGWALDEGSAKCDL